MTNDRFDDALRRKLEEVKPPYQEKNWFQLQRFMAGRGFPPSVWQSPVQWLQPALTAAAAAGLLVVSVWQYRTNQTLNERVTTLTQTVSRLEQVQTALQQTVSQVANASRHADTVYVVQRVAVPISAGLERTQFIDRYADVPSHHRMEARSQPDGNTSAEEPIRTQPDQLTPESAVVAPSTNRLAGTGTSTRVGTSRQVRSGTSMPDGPPDASVMPNAARRPSDRRGTAPTDQLPDDESRTNAFVKTPKPGIRHDKNLYSSPTTIDREAGRREAGRPTVGIALSANERISVNAPLRPTASDAPAGIGPVAGITDLQESGEIAEQWERHLRRVRYRSPYAVAAKVAPEKHTNPTSLRWRLGVGGDVGTVQMGVGVYGEVLINDRFTISTGIGQAAWAGDTYQTEVQFEQRTKRDFRGVYPGIRFPDKYPPGPIPMPRQVVDISRSGVAMVVPVQVGYRIGVGRQFFLTPFVGMNLSLNPTETLNFGFERSFSRDIDRYYLEVNRPADLYSSWMLGFGVERKIGPLVAQLSPKATVPVDRRDQGLNAASVGLRARVYYQF